jgi:hypothetical protein
MLKLLVVKGIFTRDSALCERCGDMMPWVQACHMATLEVRGNRAEDVVIR